jgi:GT2 family glycosyltransferase
MAIPHITTVHRTPHDFQLTLYFESEPAELSTLTITTLMGELLHELVPIPLPAHHGWTARVRLPSQLSGKDLRLWWDKKEVIGSPLLAPHPTIGAITHLDALSIRGWGIDLAHPDRPVEFTCRIDGTELLRFRANTVVEQLRESLASLAKAGQLPPGCGLPPQNIPPLFGFELPAPKILRDGRKHLVEIAFLHNGCPLQHSGQFVCFPMGETWRASQRMTQQINGYTPPARNNPQTETGAVQVAVIVLNRNGAENLDELFQSWQKYHSGVEYEFIIIDHASTDQSLSVIEHWARLMPIRLIALTANDSFSASCNRGARSTDAPYLLFLNNDIVWVQNVLPSMLETLQADRQIVAVGIKLLKKDHPDPHIQPIIQHLGIRFQPHRNGYMPYEIAPHTEPETPAYAPIIVPAVTGAALLCRRDEFLALGGFSEDYFYGFEDIELCLRFAARTGKKIVCRNDLVAVHKHGYTRLTQRGHDVIDRIAKNETVFQQHCGLWLKQAYWRSLWQQDGLLTCERPTIGVVAPEQERDPWNQWAHWLGSAIPRAEIRVLPEHPGPSHVADLHLLFIAQPIAISMPPFGSRSDLLVLAVINSLESARDWPQLEQYDLVVTRNTALASSLRHELGRPVYSLSPSHPLGEWFSAQEPPLRIAITHPPRLNARKQKILHQWQTLYREQGGIVRLFPKQEEIFFVFDLCYDFSQSTLPKTAAELRQHITSQLACNFPESGETNGIQETPLTARKTTA